MGRLRGSPYAHALGPEPPPWSFVVVDDPTVRAKLLVASYGQPQIAYASRLVVFAAKKNFGPTDVDAVVARIAEVRGISVESLAAFRSKALGSVVQGMDDDARRAWAAN